MSVDFSWNTAMSVPLLKLSREERASGWPASFSLKRIALLQYPDLDPTEPGNWRVRKNQDVIEQTLRQAVLSGSLDAIDKSDLVEQDNIVRGDDGVQRIVQGTRAVETHEIAALALLNWFNEQDIAPSEHMRAWFDATGASFAVLWKEKNEKYVHPGEEADRFTERNFIEGFEGARRTENRQFVDGFNAVQDQRRNDPSRAARIHDVNLAVDRCRELANKEKLTIADWTELTGVGRGVFGMYEISADCIQFRRWTDEEIRGFSSSEQPDMDRENDSLSLSFACSPSALVTFVDCADIGGRHFDVPEAFRLAASQPRHAAIDAKAIPTVDTLPQKQALTVMKKKAVLEMLSRRYPMLDNDLKRSEPWTKECKVDGRSGYYYLEMVEQGCVSKWGGAPNNREVPVDPLSLFGQLNPPGRR